MATLLEYQLTLSWWVHSNSFRLERVYLSQGLFFQHPIYPWKRTDSGWKGKRERTADYLLHTSWHFWRRLRWRRTQWWLHNSYNSHWKRNQDAVSWVTLFRAQDQGLRFWQTKSHAIIVQDPEPAESIYKVIFQNGDRILFERLSNPRPAPKVTLKSNWHSQAAAVYLWWCVGSYKETFYGTLSHLLTESHNSKSIFE